MIVLDYHITVYEIDQERMLSSIILEDEQNLWSSQNKARAWNVVNGLLSMAGLANFFGYGGKTIETLARGDDASNVISAIGSDSLGESIWEVSGLIPIWSVQICARFWI